MDDVLTFSQPLLEAGILVDQIVFKKIRCFWVDPPGAEVGRIGFHGIGNDSAVESFLSVFESSGAELGVTFEFVENMVRIQTFAESFPFEYLQLFVQLFLDEDFSIYFVKVHFAFTLRQA